jgi:2-phospho-L-lactate guanylyltransferase (CobY/MobA/RfbA family)
MRAGKEPRHSVAALIPVKGFINAKQRLAGLLGGRERALLAE